MNVESDWTFYFEVSNRVASHRWENPQLKTFYPGMHAVVMEHDITAWLERWTIKRY